MIAVQTCKSNSNYWMLSTKVKMISLFNDLFFFCLTTSLIQIKYQQEKTDKMTCLKTNIIIPNS